MAMLDMSRQLLHGWEAGDMGDGGCEEAGLQRPSAPSQSLRQRHGRLRRMAQCLVAVILLLLLVTLASVIVAVQAWRAHRSPDGQPTLPPASPSSGLNAKQQQHRELKNPYAMLTAPQHNITDGTYLNWETGIGRSLLRNGFSYSGGDLVVPREGIYRVFLQITYKSEIGYECKTDLGERLELINDVMVFQDSYRKYVSLLQSFDTVSCSMEQWKKSLYTSGLFFLEANSKLHVTSSKSDHIMKNEKLTFFGVEFVSD